MLEALKRLFKHSAIYAIGTGIQSMAGLFLIPLYTKNLDAKTFGQLELLNTIILVLANLLSLGFASAYLKCLELDVNKEKEKKALASTAFFTTLIFSTTLTLFLLFLAPTIGSFFKLDSTLYVYIVFGTNLSFISFSIGLAFLRAAEKSISYTLISITKFILVIGLNTYFVLVLKWGLLGILSGNLISQVICLLLLIPTFVKSINFSFKKELLKKLMIFGLAVIPSGLAMWVMDLSDRYLLNYYLDTTDVGYYALAYKFGYLISLLLVTPFQLAWPTVSFSLAKNKEAKKIYAKVLTYFLFVSFFVGFLITIFSKNLIPIISKTEYLKALDVIPWVAFAYVLLGVHFIIVVGLHIKNKSKYYPILIIIPGLMNLGLNFFVIPRFGIIGAGMSTFISFLVLAILTVLIVDKYYHFEYETSRLVKLLFALVLPLTLFYLFKEKLSNHQILFDLTLILVYILVLVVTRFFSKKELYYLRHMTILLKKQ